MIRRLAGRAVVLLGVVLSAVACQPTVAPSLTTHQTPSIGPTSSLATAPSAPSASGGILVDESLMDVLPVAVGGIVLTSDPETAATIAADPALAGSATAIAVAFAITPGASGDDDIAVASVVQLRDGVFDDDFYRAWRDSYDSAACEAAGGVGGHAESVIGGRHTYIGTCAAGAHTYHVYLEGQDVIVSVTSVGERRLGEQVIAGLRG